MDSGSVSEEKTLVIDNGEFVDGVNSADGVEIDMKGKYICPGLIDAHVHVTAVPGTTVSGGSLQL